MHPTHVPGSSPEAAPLWRTAPSATPPRGGWPAFISERYPETPAPKVRGAHGFRE
jgi:hypothetical protein